MSEKLTEEWLREAGFRWHQFDRQPNKQWLLWLGDALGRNAFTSHEDLGIEVAADGSGKWFCWLRSDAAHRYHRFIHIRHIETVEDLTALVGALTGQAWNRELVWNGCFVTPERAEWFRKEHDRIDKKLMREGHPWYEAEKDETMSGPLPEHVNFWLDSGSRNDPKPTHETQEVTEKS